MALEDIAVKVEGVWLPKRERHLLEWMTTSKGAHREGGRITYQWAKQTAAREAAAAMFPDLKDRVFMDVGAHVGLWSMWWAGLVRHVEAYEPVPEMQLIYRANMQGLPYVLHPYALGDTPGSVTLSFNPENTGNTHRAREGDTPAVSINAPVLRLDDEYSPQDPPVGVLKIDCEGSEVAVVRGGLALIERDRPLIVVEQKKGADYYGDAPDAAVALLRACGYQVLRELSGDFIMGHEARL
jgi:FkbM family methyltransferase